MARLIKKSFAGVMRTARNLYEHYISPAGPSFL